LPRALQMRHLHRRRISAPQRPARRVQQREPAFLKGKIGHKRQNRSHFQRNCSDVHPITYCPVSGKAHYR
jgi:hypothetical protein